MFKKLKSVKNLLLVWVVLMITIIVFFNMTVWMPLVQGLSFAVLAYFPANVFQKNILKDKEER